MTKREIFFIVSFVCFGIFILLGTYMWKESYAITKEVEGPYTKLEGEMKTQSTSPDRVTANPAAAATTETVSENVQYPQPNPAPTSAVKSDNFFITGCKVGEVVKLGDVEMIVTKATTRYKVIDITFNGNTPKQPPRLVRAENNRIVYEIPADVDVNVDVTEKTIIDKQ